ncbi:MAG: nitroreductase family protein [Pseudonocardia sp.]|nr:nitroreductase family protein [Pseudonocardia sp.]
MGPHHRGDRVDGGAGRRARPGADRPWYLTGGPVPEPDFDFPVRYEGVYRDRRRESGLALYDSVGIASGDRAASAARSAKNFAFFGAPHVVVVTTEAELGVYGAVDCGLYVNSFLLAVQSLGLGAIPQAALAIPAQFVREHFGLPQSRRVVCGISFGLPDPSDPANRFRTARVPVADTVSWVTWPSVACSGRCARPDRQAAVTGRTEREEQARAGPDHGEPRRDPARRDPVGRGRAARHRPVATRGRSDPAFLASHRGTTCPRGLVGGQHGCPRTR